MRSTIAFWSIREKKAYLPTLANLASRELFLFTSKDFTEQLAAYNTMVFAQLSELDLDGETALDGLRDVNLAIPNDSDSGYAPGLPIKTQLSNYTNSILLGVE